MDSYEKDEERIAIVEKFPECNFCIGVTLGGIEVPTKAFFDGKQKANDMWGFFCKACWEELGIGELGTGKGQRLIVREEYK